MIIELSQLNAILLKARPANLGGVCPVLQKYMPMYGIDTVQRVGGFIAQCAEESLNFSTVLEMDSGEEYEGNKMLGNTEPGDGPKFKGRGYIQITGRAAYKACSLHIFKDERLIDNPDLLCTRELAAQSACWFWRDVKGLNVIADKPEDWTNFSSHFKKTYTKIQWMTILINGGLNGFNERNYNYQAARRVLNF